MNNLVYMHFITHSIIYANNGIVASVIIVIPLGGGRLELINAMGVN